jgi:hypothetical protein
MKSFGCKGGNCSCKNCRAMGDVAFPGGTPVPTSGIMIGTPLSFIQPAVGNAAQSAVSQAGQVASNAAQTIQAQGVMQSPLLFYIALALIIF